ncbi:MAG: hypothetical protein ACI87N_003684 [Flavobacteriales bacterium]|jgi:hypothetical protein
MESIIIATTLSAIYRYFITGFYQYFSVSIIIQLFYNLKRNAFFFCDTKFQ